MPGGDLVFAFPGLNIAASLVSLLCSPCGASLGLYHSPYPWVLAVAVASSSQRGGLAPCGSCGTAGKAEFYFVAVLCLYSVTSPRVCEKRNLANFDPAAGKHAPFLCSKPALKRKDQKSFRWRRRSGAWG